MLRDCNTPATRPSCSPEPVPGQTPHPSSYKAGERPEEITRDSADINWRVNSDLSDPNHEEGAADNPDTPGSDDKELRESGDEAPESGTLSDQIKLFPINCERAKYIEVMSELSHSESECLESDRHLGDNAMRCLTEHIAVHNSS
mgnify:CR=1 FL=1